MPRGIKGGRPEAVEVMRWGALILSRPDSLNWQLDGDGRTTYHITLPTALLAAAYRVADKAHKADITAWLTKFNQTTDKIIKALPEVVDSMRAKKLLPKPEAIHPESQNDKARKLFTS